MWPPYVAIKSHGNKKIDEKLEMKRGTIKHTVFAHTFEVYFESTFVFYEGLVTIAMMLDPVADLGTELIVARG
jgi:hypothetical protein